MSVTSSVEVHVPLVMVQRSVTVVPAGTVIAAVGLFILAAGKVNPAGEEETTLHAPVPTVGALAANVKAGVLH